MISIIWNNWTRYQIWTLSNLRILNASYLCRIWPTRDIDGEFNQFIKVGMMRINALDPKIQSTKVLSWNFRIGSRPQYRSFNPNICTVDTFHWIRSFSLWIWTNDNSLFKWRAKFQNFPTYYWLLEILCICHTLICYILYNFLYCIQSKVYYNLQITKQRR